MDSILSKQQQGMVLLQSVQRSSSGWLWQVLKACEQAQMALRAVLLLVGGPQVTEPFVVLWNNCRCVPAPWHCLSDRALQRVDCVSRVQQCHWTCSIRILYRW